MFGFMILLKRQDLWFLTRSDSRTFYYETKHSTIQPATTVFCVFVYTFPWQHPKLREMKVDGALLLDWANVGRRSSLATIQTQPIWHGCATPAYYCIWFKDELMRIEFNRAERREISILKCWIKWEYDRVWGIIFFWLVHMRGILKQFFQIISFRTILGFKISLSIF